MKNKIQDFIAKVMAVMMEAASVMAAVNISRM